MKSTSIAICAMLTGLILSATAQVRKGELPSTVRGPHNLRIRQRNAKSAPLLRLASPSLPASASSDVTSTVCPPDAAGAVCGYVKVPFDRKQPEGTKLAIYFELYPHSSPGAAESAILMNFGGPGEATSGDRFSALYVFGNNLDAHDLLLIDDRGRGLSGALDCPELQHGTASFQKSMVDCTTMLGRGASRYGTGDIAQDTDAVRAALGYDKVDYYGDSYGTIDAVAYATRFGDHLRSLVLDSPIGNPSTEFARLRYRPHAYPRILQVDCLRSLNCGPDHPDPINDFGELVETIRHHPVEGLGHDANGNLVRVKVDENALLNFIVGAYPSGYFTSIGEILAAGSSLKGGDPAPILRLQAEGFSPFIGDSGDPGLFSAAAYYASACSDAHEPWDWSLPISQRKKQYADAVDDLPANYFSPFSTGPPTGLLFGSFGKQCLWWEIPTASSPVVPRHAKYPHVPTLVLDGDLDNLAPLEEASVVSALFPESTFLPVAGVGHSTVFWSQCPQNIVSEFVENLHLEDTSCTSVPPIIPPAVGRFPYLAKDARPAEVADHTNQIGRSERRVATVAIATMTDALQRSLLGSGDGAGLRSGTFHTDYTDVATITLSNCAFAKDVSVSGTVTWGADNSIIADLTVSGSGTAGGILHVEGAWLISGPVGKFKLSGMLGGKEVSLLVPES